jgi:hypothetical protein
MSGMKTTSVFMAMLLVAGQAAAASNCVEPSAPAIPEGSTASMEEMVEAQTAVKTYQTAMSNYRMCIENHMASIDEALKEGDKEAGADYLNHNRRFNEAVSNEEVVAEEFNTAIRAYKAANPS